MIRHRLGFTDKLAIIPERSMVPKVSFSVLFVSVVLATIMLTVFVFGPGLENYASHTQPYGTIRLANPIDEPEIDPGERTSSSDFTEGAEIIIPSDGTTEEESQDKGQPKNLLFIIVDDLRPQLGAYHDPEHPDHFGKVRMYTPNLDKLASQSILFTHAYAQYSLCGPSRASLLTSRRPDVTKVFGNEEYWRNVGGNFTYSAPTL
ncbi:hypothetical protein LSH36_258g00001 [Paralvinella palmiformis]|uniref:Sulfatase N-terminal domain-containing protein n=1 Tax=Paralvinella palmiformis TaxID=53620 RepID=A0AAD9JL51_9ANNE|nr:hypothetical protein LSH36_258g00001 [Paralvinella palmiformis]